MERTGTDIVVLAGGQGTRLGSLGATIPKALLPVDGRPFATWQAQEITRAPNAIRRILYSVQGRYAPLFVDIAAHVIPEESPMGTGGAILQVFAQRDVLQLSDPFLVINGDVLFEMHMDALIASAQKYGAAMQGIAVDDITRFGCITTDGARVTSFTSGNAGAGIINAGLYAFTHRVLENRFSAPCSFETDIAPHLAATGQLGLIEGAGAFIDIGTPDAYAQAAAFIRQFRPESRRAANS